MIKSLHAATLLVLAVGANPVHAVGEWGQEIFNDSFEDASTCSPQVVLPDGSTRNLLATANITYGTYPLSRNNLDMGLWDDIWGYNNTTSPQVPWPGVGGAAPVIRFFPRHGENFSNALREVVSVHRVDPVSAARMPRTNRARAIFASLSVS